MYSIWVRSPKKRWITTEVGRKSAIELISNTLCFILSSMLCGIIQISFPNNNENTQKWVLCTEAYLIIFAKTTTNEF